jgi:hypothetical protein
MDLRKIIEHLHCEKDKLDHAIAFLEELQGAVTVAAPEKKCRKRKLLKPSPPESLGQDGAGDGQAQQPVLPTTPRDL